MNVNVEVQDLYDPEESLILDPDSLDPNKHYRFVQDRPENMARKRHAGYQVVSRSKDKVKTIAETDGAADDTIRVGDSVLMWIPAGRYAARKSRKEQYVNDRIEATTQRMREKIERAQAGGLKVRMTDNVEKDHKEPED